MARQEDAGDLQCADGLCGDSQSDQVQQEDAQNYASQYPVERWSPGLQCGQIGVVIGRRVSRRAGDQSAVHHRRQVLIPVIGDHRSGCELMKKSLVIVPQVDHPLREPALEHGQDQAKNPEPRDRSQHPAIAPDGRPDGKKDWRDLDGRGGRDPPAGRSFAPSQKCAYAEQTEQEDEEVHLDMVQVIDHELGREHEGED